MGNSKFTQAELRPDLLKTIEEALDVGVSRKDAARIAGITDDTLRHYEIRGQKALEKPLPKRTKTEQMFAEFANKIHASKDRHKVYLLGLLKKAAEGDWRAGGFLLEKLYPLEFGKRLEVHAEVEVEEVPHFDLSKLTMGELKELKRIRAKMGADEKGD